MKKLFTIAMIFGTIAVADTRYYAEYKNNAAFIDDHYVDNSSINNVRLGVQGDNLYFEAGAAEQGSEFGYSFETGYKFKFDSVELKGKIEGIDIKSDDVMPWKTEVEFRYYFN